MAEFGKTISLNEGTNIFIRLFKESDKMELETFFKKLPSEDSLYLKEDVTSSGAAERWVGDLDQNKIYPLIVTSENKIIACGKLRFTTGWMRHIAEARIIVGKNFQKQGVGVIILNELLKKAIERKIKKIVVYISSQQSGAIKAFERMGFKTESTISKFVLDLNGIESNLVIMTRDVDELWRQMEDVLFEYDIKKFD